MVGLTTPIPAMSFEYHADEAGVSKLRTIFSHLSQLGNYEANLVGEENNSWRFPDWIPNEEFIASFPSCASPYFWGDVFVRLI
jgi:hypothetical protein